jgi:hypothetical protein
MLQRLVRMEEEEEEFFQLTKPVTQSVGLGFEPLLGLMNSCSLL